MFPAMPYLQWIEGRPAAATYDLGSSDISPEGPTDGVVPRPLAGYEDPPAEPTLAARLAAEYGVDPDEVLVTAGATHANFLAEVTALSLSDRGASEQNGDAAGSTTATDSETADPEPQVLVEKPCYQPLTATPASLGANVDRFLRPAAEEYRLLPDRVENAVTDEFALATVTNRHNPTGRLTTRETLAAVARIAADAGGFLLVDEVYAPYVGTDGDDSDDVTASVDEETERRTALGGTTAAGLPYTVTTGSLTKFHGLGGLRIGWLVGPEQFVARAKTVATHVPGVAEPSRALARRAFHHEERLAEHQRSLLAENHERLAAFVAERDDLSGEVHAGSSFSLLAHEAAAGDTVAERAWDEGLLVVPGRFFDASESFRLSLGRDIEEVAGGLRVLGDVLDTL
jgi:aspartate/methionine/tyrosine aminotransferase